MIGELSRGSGVPTKTIRYYEDVGLVPQPQRTDSGYRTYDETAIGRLGFVRAAQSVGLSLGEIRETLAFRDRGEVPCAHVTALIERHAVDLAERIAALESMRSELARLAKKSRSASNGDIQGASYCHIIEGAVEKDGTSKPIVHIEHTKAIRKGS